MPLPTDTRVTRAQIVGAARAYVGSVYVHNGRVRGAGIDCAGLLCLMGDDLNLPYKDIGVYPRAPDGHSFEKMCDGNMHAIPVAEAGMGDVLGFWYAKRNLFTHVGVATPLGMVHTYANGGVCVEGSLGKFWEKRLMLAWRFPGVVEADGPIPYYPPEDLIVPPWAKEGCCG